MNLTEQFFNGKKTPQTTFKNPTFQLKSNHSEMFWKHFLVVVVLPGVCLSMRLLSVSTFTAEPIHYGPWCVCGITNLDIIELH